MRKKILLSILLILLISTSLLLVACELEEFIEIIDSVEQSFEDSIDKEVPGEIQEEGLYNSLEDVAFYIHKYGKLPNNFIRKEEAVKLGWESNKGNLWDVTDKKNIGGDRFGNREGFLPKDKDRQYYEADICYDGGFRGPERIVYSNDGLVYYTKDHYKTFVLLYGDE